MTDLDIYLLTLMSSNPCMTYFPQWNTKEVCFYCFCPYNESHWPPLTLNVQTKKTIYFFQNVYSYVPQRKERHTYLKQIEQHTQNSKKLSKNLLILHAEIILDLAAILLKRYQNSPLPLTWGQYQNQENLVDITEREKTAFSLSNTKNT